MINIPPQSDAKFRVTADIPEFDMERNDFHIIILNQVGRMKANVDKDECFKDNLGKYYFTLERMATGLYFAKFVASVPDDDYNKQERIVTDNQLLCFVGNYDANLKFLVNRSSEHKVHYEQVWTANLDDGEYLADINGDFVLTADGQRISFQGRSSSDGKVRLQMTGDEFKQLIEGRDPNGEVNTIPELMDAMRGITDEETIQHDVQEQIEENNLENEEGLDELNHISLTDEDLEDIFKPNPTGQGGNA